MLLNQLKLQIIGVINLALPIIVFAQFFPITPQLHVVCSILIGIYVAYLNFKVARTQTHNLQFEPSGVYKEEFERHITDCGIDPKTVTLRYGYSNEMIATTTFNTIMVDPLFWKQIDTDQKAIEARDVINKFILPHIPETQKTRLPQISEILSQKAQNFIMKHEVGHIFHNYSRKKIALMGIIGTCATHCSITVALVSLKFMPGVCAVIVAIFCGAICDLVLNQASNLFFKLAEEKKSDIFAAKYCDAEEILAAADFFEKYQEITNSAIPKGLFSQFPALLTGYPDGRTRAAQLRELALQQRQI